MSSQRSHHRRSSVEANIEAFIAGEGNAVTFSRNETDHVLCVARVGEEGATYEGVGNTPFAALFTAATKAQQETTRSANPHLEP